MKAGDEGVRAITIYLSKPIIPVEKPVSHTVHTLDLMDNGITSLGCEFLGNALHPSSNKDLKKLMLDHNLIGTQGIKNLCEGRTCPSDTQGSL